MLLFHLALQSTILKVALRSLFYGYKLVLFYFCPLICMVAVTCWNFRYHYNFCCFALQVIGLPIVRLFSS